MGWILRTCMHNGKFCVVENLVEMPNSFLPWIAFYLPFPSPAKGLLQKLKTIQTVFLSMYNKASWMVLLQKLKTIQIVFLSMYNKASWMVFLLGVSSKEGGGGGILKYLFISCSKYWAAN